MIELATYLRHRTLVSTFWVVILVLLCVSQTNAQRVKDLPRITTYSDLLRVVADRNDSTKTIQSLYLKQGILRNADSINVGTSKFIISSLGNIKKWGNRLIDDIPATDSTKVLYSNGKWKVASSGSFDTTANYTVTGAWRFVAPYGGSSVLSTNGFNVNNGSPGAPDQFKVDANGNIVKLNGWTVSFPYSAAPTAGKVLGCTNTTGGQLDWVDASGVDTSKGYIWTGAHQFKQQYTYFGSLGSVPGELVLRNDNTNSYSTIIKTSGTSGADRTITLPDSTGTIPLRESTNRFTAAYNSFDYAVKTGLASSLNGGLIIYQSGSNYFTNLFATSATLTGSITVRLPGVNTVFPSTQGAASTYLQNDGSGNLSWVAGTGASGVTTVGAINGVTKSANGLVISGANIYTQTADETYPGMISTGTQSLAGTKTWTGANTFNYNGNQITLGADAAITGKIKLFHADNSYYGIFQAGSLTANRTYTPPDATGTISLAEMNETVSGNKTHTGSIMLDGEVELNMDGDASQSVSGKNTIIIYLTSQATLTLTSPTDGQMLWISNDKDSGDNVIIASCRNGSNTTLTLSAGESALLRYRNSESIWYATGF